MVQGDWVYIHSARLPYTPNESIRINVTLMNAGRLKHDLLMVVKRFQTSPIHHSQKQQPSESMRCRWREPASLLNSPGLWLQGEAELGQRPRHIEGKDTPNHGAGKIAPLYLEFLNLYAHPIPFSMKAAVWEIRAERELPYCRWAT